MSRWTCGAVRVSIAATDAARVIDGVFEELLPSLLFHKGSYYGAGGAHLVFSTFINGMGLGFEKTETYLAVAADVIGVHTFDSRFLQYTFCLAFCTGTALMRIYLPGIGMIKMIQEFWRAV